MACMLHQDTLTRAQQEQDREDARSQPGQCTMCHQSEQQLGEQLAKFGRFGSGGHYLRPWGEAQDREWCSYCDKVWHVLTQRLGYSQQKSDLAKRDDVTKLLRRNRDILVYAQREGIAPEVLGYLFGNLRYGEALPAMPVAQAVAAAR